MGFLDAGAHPGPMGNLGPHAPHLPQPTPPLGWSGGAVHPRVVAALSSQLLLCRALRCSLQLHPTPFPFFRLGGGGAFCVWFAALRRALVFLTFCAVGHHKKNKKHIDVRSTAADPF